MSSSSEGRRNEMLRVGARSRSWLLWCVGLAGCPAQSGPEPQRPVPKAAAAGATTESPWLGAWPKDGCFGVTRDAPDWYHFVIDGVTYQSQYAHVGDVGIIVRAVDIGDLVTEPSRLPRAPRLEFRAKGEASGAFEVQLFLIDPQGNEYESRTLTRPCDNTKAR